MVRFFRAAAAFSAALTLLLGCGHQSGSQKLTDSELKALDAATPEIKQMWSAALEASKTNDYAGGMLLLNKLLTQDLSPAQREAVSKQSTALKQRLDAAVDKGDPEARKALEELRQSAPNRPR